MYDTITTHIEGIYKLNHTETSFLIRQLVSISVCIIKLNKTAMRTVNKISQMPRYFWAMPWLSAADVVPCPGYLSLFSEQKSAAGAPVFRGALCNIAKSRMFSVFIDGLTGWKCVYHREDLHGIKRTVRQSVQERKYMNFPCKKYRRI